MASSPPIDAAGADVVVDLDDRGPAFPPLVLGTNVPAWLGPERLASEELRAATVESGATILRMPGGSWSNSYDWRGCETHDRQACYFPDAARPTDFIDFMQATGLEGMWTVSINDTAQSAAALVAFFNGEVGDERSIGVDRWGRDWRTVDEWAALRSAGGNDEPVGLEWWEVGNEVYGGSPESGGDDCAPFGWEDVWTCDGEEYVLGDDGHDGYLDIRAAMRDVDPDIQVGAVGVAEPVGWGDWGNEVIETADDDLDFYVVHHYGFDDSPDPNEAVQRPAQVWPGIVGHLTDRLGATPVAVTEYNLVSFGEADTDRSMTQAVSALYLADTIGQLAWSGVTLANQWNLANGTMSTGTDYGMVDADTFAPNPQYHAMQAWRSAGETMLSAEVADGSIRAYPTIHDDGRVTIVLLHLGSGEREVTIRLDGASTGGTAVRSGVHAEELAAGSMQHDVGDPISLVDGRFDLVVPPYSISTVEVSGAG
ncbi:MAG: alpha-L-arabinofuranosidase [Acidimicrobiia bacterium]|nr:alpha-L-arabinofuranosidase [Acidimicrobiia bacterium]